MKTYRQFLEETRIISQRGEIPPIDEQETPEQLRHWDEEDHFHDVMRNKIEAMTNGDISTASEIARLKSQNPSAHKEVFDAIHSHMKEKFGKEWTPVHTELTIGRVHRAEQGR